MNKNIYLIAITTLLFLFVVKLQAEPFVPQLYIGGGYGATNTENSNNVTITNYTNNTTTNSSQLKNTTKAFNYKEQNINISLGISPHLPIIFLNNLRLQVEYNKDLSKNKMLIADTVALGAYFDLYLGDFLPILTPYIGVTAYYPINLTIKTENYLFKERDFTKTRTLLTSFNVGFNLRIPLTPLSLFAEYRYTLGNLNINFKNTEQCNQYTKVKGDYTNSNVIIGIKYTF